MVNETFPFTQELIDRLIAYYFAQGEVVDTETARDYLHDMAELFEVMSSFIAGSEAAGRRESPPPAASGLDIQHI